MSSYDSVQLARLASDSEVDLRKIVGLLDTLNAPSSLTRIRAVLMAIKSLLGLGRVLNVDLLGEFELDISVSDVERLCLALNSWARNPAESVQDLLDISPVPRGSTETHPEWVMLAVVESSDIHGDRAFLECVYVVLYCSLMQRFRSDHPEIWGGITIGAEIKSGCLSIRKLAEGGLRLSDRFAVQSANTLSEYFARLPSGEVLEGSGWEGVELLVRRVVEVTGQTRFSVGGRRRGSIVKTVQRADPDEGQVVGPGAEIQAYEALGTKKERGDARASGLHPEEMNKLQAVATVYSPQKPTGNFAQKDHVRRQSSQIKHISTLNQRLPFRYQQLTNTELAVAASLPFELIKNRDEPNSTASSNDLDDYVAVLLQLILWLGRPVEQLWEIRIYSDLSDVPTSVDGLLAYIIDDDSFVIPIASPKWRKKLGAKDKFILEDIGGGGEVSSGAGCRIIVRSPIRFNRSINRLSENRELVGSGSKKLLFPGSLQDAIFKRLKGVVAKKNASDDLRLTTLKISQAMFDEIARISSDWVEASLLTGHTFTTTEVSAHYYSVSGEYLQERYQSAAISLRNRLYQYLNVETEDFHQFDQENTNKGVYGSKLNVHPRLVETLVRHFKQQIRNAKRRRPSGVEIHNSLVTYIAFWILFTTGYRAVNDLIFSVREIDWDTGFLVISDKDNEDESNSRIVWLPPQIIAQLKSYLKHLEVLKTMAPAGSGAFDHMSDLLDNDTPESALFFFIKTDFSVERLTPESLRQKVEVDYSLPMNLGRHYLRPQLRLSGCPAEYVNAYLGHWQIGQSPFGQFSSMTPNEMFSAMAPHLEALRRNAGWTSMNGVSGE